MDLNVKAFAQLMILSPEVALAFDKFSNSNFDIDSYEVAEHPDSVSADVKSAMKMTSDSVINSDLEEIKTLYQQLLTAGNDSVFWELLKARNNSRKKRAL